MTDSNLEIDLNQALAYRIHRSSRILRIHLIRLLAKYGDGMTPEQYFVFYRAHQGDGCRQGELADPRLEDYSNITRLVDSLVRRKLLKRKKDPSDRRKHRIFLTEKGNLLAKTLITQIQKEREILYGDMEARRIKAFLETLDMIEKRAEERFEAF